MPDLSLENEAEQCGFRYVAGIDEVGRGPLAGPVVAAAAILVPDSLSTLPLGEIDDSKRLTAKKREYLYDLIIDQVPTSLGIASVDEIDQINILQASLLAMKRAVERLSLKPDFALLDGNRLPNLIVPAKAVVKGDSISLSIAAASIVAKVARDRMMSELARSYPGYGWERNAGYGTKAHMDALIRLGVTPIHRRSFAPVARQISALTSIN